MFFIFWLEYKLLDPNEQKLIYCYYMIQLICSDMHVHVTNDGWTFVEHIGEMDDNEEALSATCR